MEEKVKQEYLEAGKVIHKARKKAREVSAPGTELLTIAEEVENTIREEGLQPAFPVNLSKNDEAAHYTPDRNSNKVLEAEDVLKIDIGAHSNGYIADTALTVNPAGNRQEIIEVVEEVLEKSLNFIEPGVTVGEFGKYVEKQVPDEYQVVRNLTGHYLGHYKQHAGISVPNVSNTNDHVFEEGDAVAVEPFITDGSGKVKEGGKGNIYRMEEEVNVRGKSQKKLVKEFRDFNGLPFTTRWIDGYGGRERMGMKKLVQKDVVHSYPILKEFDGGTVAQAEHTVIIGEEGDKIVTTR